MAIVNKGFPGTVNATEYAKSWHLGGSDACMSTGWLVTQGTGRQTSTAAGDAFASGVLSENSAPILTSLSTPVAGQWFLIVRRIDWAGAGTVTVAAVAHSTTSTTIPTAAPGTFPTINEDPGVLYDHKLAWAWVRNTDTTMVLFDLRELALEPRLQAAETSIAAVVAGAGRGTGALFLVADLTALDAVSTATIGDTAFMTTPGTGIDAFDWEAFSGSGATIDWRAKNAVVADTKAHLDTFITAVAAISDTRFQIGNLAVVTGTGGIYRFTSTAGAYVVHDARHIEYTATSASVATATPASVGTLSADAAASNDTTIATISTNTLTLAEAGIYEVSVYGTIGTTPTGVTYIQVGDGTNFFKVPGFTIGTTIGGALVSGWYWPAATVLTFQFYHTSAANRTLTSRIALTKVG